MPLPGAFELKGWFAGRIIYLICFFCLGILRLIFQSFSTCRCGCFLLSASGLSPTRQGWRWRTGALLFQVCSSDLLSFLGFRYIWSFWCAMWWCVRIHLFQYLAMLEISRSIADKISFDILSRAQTCLESSWGQGLIAICSFEFWPQRLQLFSNERISYSSFSFGTFLKTWGPANHKHLDSSFDIENFTFS